MKLCFPNPKSVYLKFRETCYGLQYNTNSCAHLLRYGHEDLLMSMVRQLGIDRAERKWGKLTGMYCGKTCN